MPGGINVLVTKHPACVSLDDFQGLQSSKFWLGRDRRASLAKFNVKAAHTEVPCSGHQLLLPLTISFLVFSGIKDKAYKGQGGGSVGRVFV